jgi:phospho-N-acetylmuramoyl-pentapeptide-transferase
MYGVWKIKYGSKSVVNTKFLSSTALKQVSGTNLLIFLTILLISFAGIYDWNRDHFFDIKTSMSLPLLVGAVVCGGLGYWVVPWLRKLKTGQFVQEDGPQTHLKKAGTPTMGGIFFVPIAILIALVWSGFTPEAIAVSAVTLAYCGIGWIDDWQVLRLKSNKGISPRMKLLLQIAVAVGFCLWVFLTQPTTLTTVALPWKVMLSLGILFWPLSVFVLVAESNATNLTDGVDGLAAGTGAIALLGLGALVAPQFPDLMLICTCLSGGCLGFVVHNRNPATVFMGDTGSLALGGILGAVGILSGNLWGLLIISGIFLVECLSVIAQVSYYKATKGPDGKGKRLLKMAPIHHHIELSGWSETQIVLTFYLINLLLVIIALLTV